MISKKNLIEKMKSYPFGWMNGWFIDFHRNPDTAKKIGDILINKYKLSFGVSDYFNNFIEAIPAMTFIWFDWDRVKYSTNTDQGYFISSEVFFNIVNNDPQLELF